MFDKSFRSVFRLQQTFVSMLTLLQLLTTWDYIENLHHTSLSTFFMFSSCLSNYFLIVLLNPPTPSNATDYNGPSYFVTVNVYGKKKKLGIFLLYNTT